MSGCDDSPFEFQHSMQVVHWEEMHYCKKLMELIIIGLCIAGGSVGFEEKKRFQRAVASGELCKLIEP